MHCEWNFFATSHGKSPCDGIGGTVKRLTTRASLQRPISNQILTAEKMFDFCKTEIEGIEFLFIRKDDVVDIRSNMETRHRVAKTVDGTRSFHQFIPISTSIIGTKYVSEDQQFALQFDFKVVKLLGPKDTLSPSQFVICVYDQQYYVGIIMEVCVENLDVKVKFMHPHLPSPMFKWPARDDLCWVPNAHICSIIAAPELKSQNARQYYFDKKECEKIEKILILHKEKSKKLHRTK